MKLDRKKSWMEHIARGTEALNSGDFKKFWQWVKTTGGVKDGERNDLQPLKDHDGILKTDPKEIAQT